MSETINIHLDVPYELKPIYRHLFEVWAFHFAVQVVFKDDAASFTVSSTEGAHSLLSYEALMAIKRHDFDWLRSNFTHLGFKISESEKVDHVTTALFMLNYLQEYSAQQYDDLGRFPFELSYQNRYSSSKQDLVSFHFDRIANAMNLDLQRKNDASRIFVSHDIDEVNSAFLENGFYALKQGRFDILLNLVFNQLMGNPQWLNMTRIMDVNDEYGIKSTFFWLVNKKKAQLGNYKLRNADYNISNKKIRKSIANVADRSFENGLHKGIAGDTFASELKALDSHVIANRNHFLKLKLPDHFLQIDKAGLQLDFSLGFAEQYGFRNSYSKPIHPFDLLQNHSVKALFVPLHIMDTTNWIYKKESLNSMKTEVLSFIESNKQDAVLSLLWHNKYFSGLKFNGYLEIYKSILDYCRSAEIKGITQSEILEKYQYNHTD